MAEPAATDGNTAQNMPAAEIGINENLVRKLLNAAVVEQGLDRRLAAQPLHLVANGWDNVMYRLGSGHMVRLPRRSAAVPLVEHEQRWLPEIAERLPVSVPVPVFAGRPVDGPDVSYPWPWSIVPWFEGESLGARTLDAVETKKLAQDLATFLHSLHFPSPVDAPANPFRGVPLSTRADRTWSYLDDGSVIEQVVGSKRADRIRSHWAEALAAPEWDREPRWLHGDLHALNLVWHRGRLAAIIDFGDITGGDPATDLAVAWSLFPDPVDRSRFQGLARIDNNPVDNPTWSRARGWALAVAAAIVTRSADNPALHEIGVTTLITVAEDDVGAIET